MQMIRTRGRCCPQTVHEHRSRSDVLRTAELMPPTGSTQIRLRYGSQRPPSALGWMAMTADERAFPSTSNTSTADAPSGDEPSGDEPSVDEPSVDEPSVDE